MALWSANACDRMSSSRSLQKEKVIQQWKKRKTDCHIVSKWGNLCSNLNNFKISKYLFRNAQALPNSVMKMILLMLSSITVFPETYKNSFKFLIQMLMMPQCF